MLFLIFGLMLLKVMNMATGTCVLESEFGFILNCNFKKSGLFRVRNLGGLKAHFGLGFSLGDELGFGESLGNLEGNRRRALNYKTDFVNKVGIVSPSIVSSTIAPKHFNHVRSFNQNTSMTEVMFLPLGVPTFRPIPKVTNNLVRRKDVVLADEITNERMTNFYYIPENTKGQTNATNSASSIINKKISFIDEQNMYNGLTNISNTVQNKGSDALRHETYDKNQVQKTEMGEYNTANIKSIKFNTALAKKSTKSSSGQGSEVIVVMNAPKEYYPSGYDKNFDDNFKSRVELPPTDFTCAAQKYFPGLYANVDLGCMVFHVCAITESGIIMKSFLCPESTLFDQSILKCNWWFYVECNNSTYDSNIPISKSYQLMKSLSYFTNFTNIAKESTQKNVRNKID